MSHRTRCVAAAATLGLLSLGPFVGGTPHASSVVSTNPGPGEAFVATAALDEPFGEGLNQGSSDVYSPGTGGSITLQLDAPALDGPGADLIVSENPFKIANTSTFWIEAVFVELSTDGIAWARVPTRYTGPAAPLPPFTGGVAGWYRGFAGVLPVTANPIFGTDALDVVAANGDAFDFADLLDHPLVTSGALDLDDVRFVRLVDVAAGVAQDTLGTPVYDSTSGFTDTCDIDAITAVNNVCNQDPGRPQVEMSLTPAGLLTIQVGDPDGLKDIKLGLAASIDAAGLNFFTLAQFFVTTSLTSTTWTLQTGPVPDGMFSAVLKVSAVDTTGRTRGDQIVIQ